MACSCGQQFKVAAQYAGQQANCPSCQALCFIPVPGQAQTPTGVPPAGGQPGVFPQPGVQQPAGFSQPVQTPAYVQPTTPDQASFGNQAFHGGVDPGYNPGGFAPAPAYTQGRKKFMTALGIFIFAIAASVYSGGFGVMRISEFITEITLISSRVSAESRMEKARRGEFVPPSRATIETYQMLGNVISVLVKIGAIAMMLGILAIVVASVFALISPHPLMALGITTVCLAATAGILMSIYELVPAIQGSGDGMAAGLIGISSLGNSVSTVFLILLTRWTELATFLIFSIFMMYACKMKKNPALADQAKYALIGFSISAGIHFLICMLMLMKISGEAIIYIFMFIRWLAHAGQIVGFVFLIKTCYSAKRHYPI